MNLIICPVVVSMELTKRCMRTLLAQDIGNIRVIIIDNGSTDGVGPYLRSIQGSSVNLITHSYRKSLNRVWNGMIDLAFHVMRLDHVLVVNNDTELLPETYRLLASDPHQFITAVSVDTREQFHSPSELLFRSHPDFSCFLIRRIVWEKVGRFDDAIHAYCGDLDYHLRMHHAGIEAGSLSIPFLHHRSSTIKLADNATRDMIQHEADLDRTYFKHKYGFEACSPEYEEQFKLPNQQP